MDSIFEHKTHFSYLLSRLDPRKSQRGVKSKLAEYLGVQPAYVSQVLSQTNALSLEQADLANQFFGHSSEESEFFLLLTSKDRAGTVSLRKIYEAKINQILSNRQLIVERLGKKSEITDESKGIYYSSWIYSAIHVSCTIPRLATRRSMSEYLHIPSDLVGRILDFLEQNLLIKKDGDHYTPTQNWLRLGKDSPHIIKHHTNWRHLAIRNLEIQTNEDLHYSGIFSMDEKSFLKIKSDFLDFIKAQSKIIESAPEQELYVMGIDFFQPFKVNSKR